MISQINPHSSRTTIHLRNGEAAKRTAPSSELAIRLFCLELAGISVDGGGPAEWMDKGEKHVRFER